jgi:hypothetical protein
MNNIGFTGYQETPARAVAGMIADLSLRDVRGLLQGEGSAGVPFGAGVVASGTEGVAVLPVDASSRFTGIAVLEHQIIKDANGMIPPQTAMSVLEYGRIWVPVEGAVSRGAFPFMRHTANGAGKLQKGLFRADADPIGSNVARVVTVTPTAADATVYGLTVAVGQQDFDFNVLSGTSATATTISALFRAQMAANALFSALVTASGTATLILTGVTPGTDFSVNNSGPGTLGIVSTTPASAGAASAVKLRGCHFMTDWSSGPGIAMLSVDVKAYRGFIDLPGY